MTHENAARQLTARAALMGMALGGVLCLSNLYVVLKTGWSLGITITATIVAFALFRVLRLVGLTRREFSALENNASATVASAGAWMTGGGNMAALPALLVLTGERPSGLAMFAWFAVIAAMGVFVAIPLKRQFINREPLPFPMSVATAHTLRTLHGGAGDAAARQLMGAGFVATLLTLWRDLKVGLPWTLPGRLTLPFSLGGRPLAAWSLGFDASLVLVGGGSLMAPRTAWSLAVGSVLTWGVLAPALVASGEMDGADFKSMVQVTLWPGAALLVTSGLVSFLKSLPAARKAMTDLRQAVRASPTDDSEAPTWWFFAGFGLLAPVMVALMKGLFGIPVWAGVLAMPLALAVGVISARVTGETDVTPTKAMGPLTQLVFGVMLPANVTANVMSANVTSGVGLHAADLLGDLKTGAILGANPRKQVIAQLLGLLVGAAVVVPAFALLVPGASVLGSEQFPAPAVMVWAGVSKVLSQGLGGLAPAARSALAWAGALGVALALLETRVARERRHLVPSPAALGIAMVIPAATALTMVLGAMLGAVVKHRWPAFAVRSMTPMASGLIAGESVTGIAVALVRALGAPI